MTLDVAGVGDAWGNSTDGATIRILMRSCIEETRKDGRKESYFVGPWKLIDVS